MTRKEAYNRANMIYEYDGDYYAFVGMGDNGFIVTAFPVGK